MRELRDIAHELGATYIYADIERANIHADDVQKFPVVIELVSAGGKYNTKHSPIVSVTQQVTIYFLDKCPLDWDAEIGGILQDCTDFGRRYIGKMIEKGINIVEEQIPINNVFNYLNANLCGVRVILNITDAGECTNG